MNIFKGFLWCARESVNGGQCRVPWEAVCAPKWVGGLGLPNLRWLNIAIQSRWLWLQHTGQSRPLAEFQIVVPEESRQLFRAVTKMVVGNGLRACFWEDRWLDGFTVQDVAPSIYAIVAPSARASRTVHQAVSTGDWALDIGPDLTGQ